MLRNTFFFIVLLFLFNNLYSQNQIKTITLTGSVHTDEMLSYKALPFYLPENIGKIEVEFKYTGKDNQIEISLYDPNGFRGSSRFSKEKFTVGKYESTASYFPGDMPAGNWNVLLGISTLSTDSTYEIQIRLIPEEHPEFTGSSSEALSKEKRWYVGDFHTHTGHSDGFGCKDTEGNRTPCQVYQVADIAHKNGLDFVAIADHNTISHYQDIKILQPKYPDMLLIRGQEVTTFFGHTNIFGLGIPADFRFGYKNYDAKKLQEFVLKNGGKLSINHPGRETGANCTGCGWNEPTIDYSNLEILEVVNGTQVETKISGIPFWHNLLNEGNRIIGIGGSDDHGAGTGNAQPGTPSTVVYANELSEKGLLNALKEGKVYIKTRGANATDIEFYASSGDSFWQMGERLPQHIINKNKVTFHIIRNENTDEKIEIIADGKIININNFEDEKLTENKIKTKFAIPLKNKRWIRFNLRDDKGITVISNPIFLN